MQKGLRSWLSVVQKRPGQDEELDYKAISEATDPSNSSF